MDENPLTISSENINFGNTMGLGLVWPNRKLITRKHRGGLRNCVALLRCKHSEIIAFYDKPNQRHCNRQPAATESNTGSVRSNQEMFGLTTKVSVVRNRNLKER